MSARIEMVGLRYGHLKVVAEAGSRFCGRQRQRLVRVRCDCGREYVTVAASVRRSVRQCVECKNAAQAELGRAASVRLPDGRTIAQIAEVCGLKLNTVYVRWMRGWPHYRLGEVTQEKRS